MKACPYRKAFFAKLAADTNGAQPPVPQAKLDEDLDKWLAGLDSIVKRMEAFYTEGKYDKGF